MMLTKFRIPAVLFFPPVVIFAGLCLWKSPLPVTEALIVRALVVSAVLWGGYLGLISATHSRSKTQPALVWTLRNCTWMLVVLYSDFLVVGGRLPKIWIALAALPIAAGITAMIFRWSATEQTPAR